MKVITKAAFRQVKYAALMRAMRTFFDATSALLGTVVVADVFTDFKAKTAFYGVTLLGTFITALVNFGKNFAEGMAEELAEVDARGTTTM